MSPNGRLVLTGSLVLVVDDEEHDVMAVPEATAARYRLQGTLIPVGHDAEAETAEAGEEATGNDSCVESAPDMQDDARAAVDRLLEVLGDWGLCPITGPLEPADCPSDLDGDGIVGPLDLIACIREDEQ